MARGRDRHEERKAAVAGMGRALSRRASNRCELCGERTSLSVIEVPEPGGSLPEEPHPDAALMACERCARAMAGGRGRPDPQELRFLEQSAWSDVAPVQVAAVRVVRALADEGVGWARELLETLYLPPEVEERL